jgi:hypothetical protein
MILIQTEYDAGAFELTPAFEGAPAFSEPVNIRTLNTQTEINFFMAFRFFFPFRSRGKDTAAFSCCGGRPCSDTLIMIPAVPGGSTILHALRDPLPSFFYWLFILTRIHRYPLSLHLLLIPDAGKSDIYAALKIFKTITIIILE